MKGSKLSSGVMSISEFHLGQGITPKHSHLSWLALDTCVSSVVSNL